MTYSFEFLQVKNKWRPDPLFWLLLIALILIMIRIVIGQAKTDIAWDTYSDEQIVNAIFIIEGGYKAQYLYGIRSVPYKDEAEARQICLRTVKNNRIRFAKQNKYKDYLEFLANRYCPIGCDNDRGTNKYWLGNLRKQLAKEK